MKSDFYFFLIFPGTFVECWVTAWIKICALPSLQTAMKIHHNEMVMRLFQNFNSQDENYLDSLVMKTIIGSFYTFDPQIGHLKSIISSGNINYIRNAQLVDLLSKFEDQSNDANEANQRIFQMWDNHMSKLFGKYIRWSTNAPMVSSSPPNFKEFFNDPDVEYYLRLLYHWNYNYLTEGADLMMNVENMISIIEGELDE